MVSSIVGDDAVRAVSARRCLQDKRTSVSNVLHITPEESDTAKVPWANLLDAVGHASPLDKVYVANESSKSVRAVYCHPHP
jgi:hypothetical protein